MRKVLLLALACVCGWPAPASAWGSDVHRYIMRRALDLLPPPLKPFYDAHREEIVVRVIDPDLWRTVGWPEDPNHFVDFGVKEYGEPPFRELPRDYDAALQKFGRDTLARNGLLPWRLAEMQGHLRRAFASFASRAQYAVRDTLLFSAVASHYIQDAHQPLHAADNYDGRQTGQDGIHSRFETELFDRFESRLTVRPQPPAAILNPRDTAFDVLLVSYQLVEPLLRADREAVEGRTAYDDKYFEALLKRVSPMLERRIAESITATASLILGAWEQAGKPMVVARLPRETQKVRRTTR